MPLWGLNIEIMKEWKFKPGDRVENEKRGKGTIICIIDGSPPILVKFDYWNNGHKGDTTSFKVLSGEHNIENNESCYYFMNEEEISLIEENLIGKMWELMPEGFFPSISEYQKGDWVLSKPKEKGGSGIWKEQILQLFPLGHHRKVTGKLSQRSLFEVAPVDYETPVRIALEDIIKKVEPPCIPEKGIPVSKFNVGDVIDINGKGICYTSMNKLANDGIHTWEHIKKTNCKFPKEKKVKIINKVYSIKMDKWWYDVNKGNWIEEEGIDIPEQEGLIAGEYYAIDGVEDGKPWTNIFLGKGKSDVSYYIGRWGTCFYKGAYNISDVRIRKATQEEREYLNYCIKLDKFVSKEEFLNSKDMELIVGKVYIHDEPGNIYIFKYALDKKSPYIYENIYVEKGFFVKNKYTKEAMFSDRQWLEACIKANKFIPKEEALNPKKDMFKEGEYIVTLIESASNRINFPCNYCYKQREDNYYLLPCIDGGGSTINGLMWYGYSEKSRWRYATKEEIVEYERKGKPYDVTILKENISMYKEGDIVVCIGESNKGKYGISAGWHKDLCFHIDAPTLYEKHWIVWPSDKSSGVFEDQVRMATEEEKAYYKKKGENYYITEIPKEKSVSEEELLEHARKYYTLGTFFKSIVSDYDKGIIREIKPWPGNIDIKWTIQKSKGNIYVYASNGMNTMGGGCFNPYIYKNGEWAPIINSPIKEQKENKMYKPGDRVIIERAFVSLSHKGLTYNRYMDGSIGKEAVIKEYNKQYDAYSMDSSWIWPSFCFSLVKEKEQEFKIGDEVYTNRYEGDENESPHFVPSMKECVGEKGKITCICLKGYQIHGWNWNIKALSHFPTKELEGKWWKDLSLEEWCEKVKALNPSEEKLASLLWENCESSRVYEKIDGKDRFEKAETLYKKWNFEKEVEETAKYYGNNILPEQATGIHISTKKYIAGIDPYENMVWKPEIDEKFDRIMLKKKKKELARRMVDVEHQTIILINKNKKQKQKLITV